MDNEARPGVTRWEDLAPSVQEHYGFMELRITETDIDILAEITEADEIAEHNRREAECCPRPNPWCDCWTSFGYGGLGA